MRTGRRLPGLGRRRGQAARWLIPVVAQGLATPGLRTEIVDVNGLPGIVAWTGEEPLIAVSLVVVDGRVQQVLTVRNPDKLAGLAQPGADAT